MRTHICEGCGAQVRAAWPTDWKGYGASAYACMPTAEWCADCVGLGVMKSDARTTRADAALVLSGRLNPTYRVPPSRPIADAVDPVNRGSSE